MQTDGTEALTSLRSFIEDLDNAVMIARTLVHEGHRIDLTGLDGQVGLLCAKALDLPPEQGRSVRPKLVGLLSTVDSLIACLTPPRT
jgi:hypothetical protein